VQDEGYAAGVERLIDRLEARDWVTLHGPVRQEQLPALLNGHRACINFSTGAVDKTAVEAMACGLPVVSTNDSAAEVIPPAIRPILLCDKHSTDAQARTIHELLRRPEQEIADLGQRLRERVITDHSIERLFDRILEEVQPLLADRSYGDARRPGTRS